MGTVGYVLLKRGVLSEQGLGILSGILVKVFMPSLIIDRLTQSFDFQKFPEWWIYPLVSMGIIFAGYGMSRLFLLPAFRLPAQRTF